MLIKPRLVDRFLMMEISFSFFGSLVLILFFLFMLQCLRLAEFLIVHHVSWFHLFELTLYLLISFMPYALPMSFLMSILGCFSRLSADSELIALKTLGWTHWRLFLPIFFFSIFIVLFSFLLHLELVPWAEKKLRIQQKKIAETKSISFIKEGIFNDGFFNLLIFSEKVDSEKNNLQNVFVYDEREPENPFIYATGKAMLKPSVDPHSGRTHVLFELFDGMVYRPFFADALEEKMHFRLYSLFLSPVGSGPLSADATRTTYSFLALSEKIKNCAQDVKCQLEFKMEYWRRVYASLSPFLFSFLGMGLGSYRARSPRAGAALIGIFILSFYWVIQSVGVEISLRGGFVPPFLAMFFPLLGLLPLTFWSFKKANW